MSRPASSTIVRRPRSQSSFAAQPPAIPDPTTMASYRSRLMAGASCGDASVVAVRPDVHLQQVPLNGPRGEVGEYGELFDRAVGALGGARVRLLHHVERPDARLLQRRRERKE